jgi:hypothetical protein
MSYKLILCEAAGCDSDPYDGCDAEVSFREVTLVDLANLDSNHVLREDLISLLQALLNSDDERVALTIRETGLVNVEKIKSRDDKLIVSKQYWVISKDTYGQFRAVDIDHLPNHVVNDLADDKVQLVQAITKPSMKKLLSPEGKKIYDREVKRLKALKAKNATAAKKRKATKKRKELERAKKLLEDAGEFDK